MMEDWEIIVLTQTHFSERRLSVAGELDANGIADEKNNDESQPMIVFHDTFSGVGFL